MEKGLETIFSKYEGKRENVIPILQKVQEEYTYLPDDLMAEIAKYTRVPASDIYGLPLFMPSFVLLPPGKILFQFAGEPLATSGVRREYLKKLSVI